MHVVAVLFPLSILGQICLVTTVFYWLQVEGNSHWKVEVEGAMIFGIQYTVPVILGLLGLDSQLDQTNPDQAYCANPARSVY